MKCDTNNSIKLDFEQSESNILNSATYVGCFVIYLLFFRCVIAKKATIFYIIFFFIIKTELMLPIFLSLTEMSYFSRSRIYLSSLEQSLPIHISMQMKICKKEQIMKTRIASNVKCLDKMDEHAANAIMRSMFGVQKKKQTD